MNYLSTSSLTHLISLNSAQISSVQGGCVSSPSSPTMFSMALLFFMPTLAGSFIRADLQLTPLVFTSAHLMPVLVSVGMLS